MSLRKNPPRRHRGGLPLTPLIDIIFLLCLFFVLNTSFRQEGYIEVNLPESETSDDGQTVEIVLTLHENGSVSIDGENVEWDSIESVLRDKAANQAARELVIQGDESIDYGRIIATLDKVRQAGFEAIALQTIRRRQ